MATDFAVLTDDDLAGQITTWAGRIAGAEARLVELIGEFDRRGAWFGPGLLSCGHWLSWRLGMGLKAAHERVRVARLLPKLPVTAAAFAAGRLSWTQVRAITRVATAADEQTYVELARHASGAQLERLVRGVRRAQRILADEADPQGAAHRMRTRITHDADGSLVLSVRLPAEDGAILLAALEAARDELDQAAKATEAQPAACGQPASAEDTVRARPLPASLADALLHVARTHLETAAATRPHVARRHRARLIAHVDPISGWARLHDGELLPRGVAPPLPATARLRPVTAADLTKHDRGRAARHPDQALRDLLTCIDGNRCRYPGCTRTRHLHAHHVRPWAAGGSTDLGNLALICSRHHALIHEALHQVTLHPDRSLTMATRHGEIIEHHPAPPWQPAEHIDPDAIIGPDTLPPAATDRLHLHYAVSVLMQQAA